tara:strand:- start:23 stop:649 length:627 start_codon:yes stop_codon:yes gene_type:complete
MPEVWKEIPDFPDYKISTLGNIMSKKYGDWRQLKINPNQTGYLRISIYNKNNIRKTCFINRLMGLTFIPNPDNLPTVDHIDRNRQNNTLYNLRWATRHDQNMNTCRTRHDITETDPIIRDRICTYESKQRAIDSKKHYCEICNKSFHCESKLQEHLGSFYHLKIVNFVPTTAHYCRPCGINCPSKSKLQIHRDKPKHKRIMALRHSSA